MKIIGLIARSACAIHTPVFNDINEVVAVVAVFKNIEVESKIEEIAAISSTFASSESCFATPTTSSV
ncbi:hypothetical protein [Desulfosporosinus sp. FKB]|uniref:hypothetical protein n=1 Tax=Desulfosporosinus sp. FKB TaxID=1969835 RepID=UPI000B4972E0|nr:hypothetical protein [Desulfosporosinus sp. FKB]